MITPSHSSPPHQHTQSGATLAAALILVSAAMLLAVSALRSATSEAQLSGTLTAAHEAFWLAELGVASAMNFARTRPADLIAAGTITLTPIDDTERGRAATVIYANATDDHCPPLPAANVVRHHFEIHATGFANRGAISTHVQGFYICSELCTIPGCDVPEYSPVRSYWKAINGGLPP